MYKKRTMLTMLESVESTKLSTNILKIINISSSADKKVMTVSVFGYLIVYISTDF